jgi:hypothetical protein
MTKRELMKNHILSNVVSRLLENDFTGKYPHFRRVDRDCIELITFQTNKWSSSFTVEVSAIFPHGKDLQFADVFKRADVAMYENKRLTKLS